ncbi:sensor histidine kinase [Maribacter sp. HTCC2170]|uniref:sensor histidine kinase n=1 Tax=Maribacter sp. (strain HTCC2170 / KCCM 42371) TaxID=313603 RepID=UPI00006B21A1|nr:sensor histidine kinase [Maribacter sp. HTCC2170]EAR00122.1 Signal transduction histidine kinase [Maribacter sp. HTCC2170]
MSETAINQERLNDKIKLVLKVNYFSSALALCFGIACYFLLGITEIIPYAFIAFGIANLINTFLFQKHKSLTTTYNITSVLALISTLIITLYSGGISSPFIFILALIVFAGYVTTRKYGQIYLNLIFFLIILVYSQSLPEFSFTHNVIPSESLDVFGLCSVLFAVYLLGHVFGKNLLRTHHALYRSKNQLQKRINEKETLLKEVHHRVKNNLQTVSSLLSLQTRSIEDDKMKNIIKSSQNRVISMAMVHEMLYMRDDLSKIEYKTYVKELSEYLIRSLKGAENNITLNIDIADIKLGIDTAIPLGLLINEAITNALKYGIVDDNEGEINIAIKKEPNNEYVLNIGDNGIGFDDTIDHKTTKSLGLKLIHNLARQLKGSISKDHSKKGTNYIVKFTEVGQEFRSIV